MKDAPTRVFSLMCALVGVWVFVYWFYEPPKPPVTFDSNATQGGPDLPVRPDPLAQLDQRPPPGAPDGAARTNPTPGAEPKPVRWADPPSGPGAGESRGTRARAVPPKFTEYVVQRGDTFELIAQKLLGDPRLSRAIASANPYANPTRLIPGRTVLRIPVDPDNIEGRVVVETVPDRPKDAPDDRAADAPKPVESAGFTTYVIKDSDTLSGISKALLGKSSRWREIFEANTDVIADPDHLKPGVTIRIPKN
ncbi:MAG: LysM peptidoglycan-binding domain-containing protein [Phycisphaerales bacterium]